jgi:hypothetical protein
MRLYSYVSGQLGPHYGMGTVKGKVTLRCANTTTRAPENDNCASASTELPGSRSQDHPERLDSLFTTLSKACDPPRTIERQEHPKKRHEYADYTLCTPERCNAAGAVRRERKPMHTP